MFKYNFANYKSLNVCFIKCFYMFESYKNICNHQNLAKLLATYITMLQNKLEATNFAPAISCKRQNEPSVARPSNFFNRRQRTRCYYAIFHLISISETLPLNNLCCGQINPNSWCGYP